MSCSFTQAVGLGWHSTDPLGLGFDDGLVVGAGVSHNRRPPSVHTPDPSADLGVTEFDFGMTGFDCRVTGFLPLLYRHAISRSTRHVRGALGPAALSRAEA